MSMANGQRGAKRHPGGGSMRSGRRAVDGRQHAARNALEIGEGVAQAHRVGVRRPRQRRLHRSLLGDAAGTHHHRAVAMIGDDRDVVRDQDDGDTEPLLQLAATGRESGAAR